MEEEKKKKGMHPLFKLLIVIGVMSSAISFVYAFVWPSIGTKRPSSVKCSSTICPASCKSGTCVCTYYDGNGNGEVVYCKAESN